MERINWIRQVVCAGWIGLLCLATPSWAQEAGQASLRLDLYPVTHATPQGAIEVDLVFRNVGTAPLSLFRTLHPDGYLVMFEITDANAKPVYMSPSIPHEQTRAFVEDIVVLNPGYFFGKRYRFASTLLLGQIGPPFAPGTYRVKARYANTRQARPNMPTGEWVSNEIEVEVVAAHN